MPEITKNQVKHIRLLKQKKYRQEFGEFIVEGKKNIHELLHSEYEIKELFITQEWEENLQDVNTTSISAKQLSQISNLSSPNLGLAIVKIPAVDFDNSILNTGLTLCLDSINDPGNLGTIIRTADWFGIQHIICSTDSVDCYNPKVVQSTKGSIFNLSVHYQNLEEVMKENNSPVYGASLEGEEISPNFNIEKPSLLLMGSESHGITNNLEPYLTHSVKIKKHGKAESLNVAIATSILLHQFTS